MIGRIISGLVAIYLVIGIVYAVIWGYVGAMFSAILALDPSGFFMSILRILVAMFMWLFILNGKFAITF